MSTPGRTGVYTGTRPLHELLALLTTGTVLGYPRLASTLAGLVADPQPHGAVARAIRDSLKLSRTFAGYVWLNAVSQNLVQTGSLFAILLGSGGLRADARGTLFTLSLPFSRRALMTTRAATGLAEVFGLAVLPMGLIVLLAPAIGEHYRVVDAVVYGACLFAGTAVFFSLTFWMATLFSGVWRPGLIACGIAIGVALCESALPATLTLGPFHVARAESYFHGAQVPWLGLVLAATLSLIFVWRAVVTVERTDF